MSNERDIVTSSERSMYVFSKVFMYPLIRQNEGALAYVAQQYPTVHGYLRDVHRYLAFATGEYVLLIEISKKRNYSAP